MRPSGNRSDIIRETPNPDMQILKELADSALVPLYLARRRRPWTAGYNTVKRRAICAAIDSRMLTDDRPMPPGYGFRLDERIVEYPWVYARLPKGRNVVLDAGSALNHAFLLERTPIRDADLTICTLAPENRCYWRRSISYVFDDLRCNRFRAQVFDAIVSVSTIEHIGLDNTLLYTSDSTKRETDRGGYLDAVREFRRIIKIGGTCLITVPFGRAKNHGWFQVFDQSMIESVIDAFEPSEHETAFFGYSPTGWHPSSADSLADATCFDIHAQKHYDPDFAAFSRGLACLRLTP